MTRIGYDGTRFNVEYFWDAERDALTLLEINPRHSQSHAELFAWVDGVANHHHMIELRWGVTRGRRTGRVPTPWRRSGSCDARPTAWCAGCRRPRRSRRSSRARPNRAMRSLRSR